MTKLTIEERVIHILEDFVIQGSDINLDCTWEELGIDSLGKVEMMMDMEDEFNIIIHDEDMQHLENVDDLIQFVTLLV